MLKLLLSVRKVTLENLGVGSCGTVHKMGFLFTGTLLWDFLSSPVQTVFSAHLFSPELPKCPVEHTALLKIGPW